MIYLFIIIYILFNYNLLTNSIINSSILWFYNVMPGLFIINIFADLLITSNINMLKPILLPIKRLFRLNSIHSSIIILISPLIGNPGAYRLIYNFYQSNKISYNEAIHLLKFNNYINPIFLITLLKKIFNYKIALIIVLSNIFSNLILGLLYFKKVHNNSTIKFIYNPIIKRLNDSLENITKMLIIVWSSIVFFGIIIDIINNIYIINILPSYIKSLLLGIIEITNGINYMNISNVNIKILYISIIIGFNGLSIIMQQYLITKNNFKLKDIIYPKIPVSLLTGIISLGGFYVL